MFSLNKIQIIGNLGKDADIKINGNLTIAKFNVATSHSYKGKDGNYVNDTTWHSCVLFNPSEFIQPKLIKGAKFYFEGRIKKGSYQNKQDVTVYTCDVIVEKVIVLESGTQKPVSEQINEVTERDAFDDLPF